MSQHIVYAAVDRCKPGDIPVPPVKVRLSEPMDWDLAQAHWNDLDSTRRVLRRVPARLTAARMPVRFFCVRSEDDPDWPADAPQVSIRIEAA
jgi:hypothetical protein